MDLAADVRDILEVQEKSGFGSNAFPAFAHRPEEFGAFLPFRSERR